MNILQRNDPRLAGEIKRFHTWPVIDRQTNANHQWNVARILLAIWPEAPREHIIHALFHDIGEITTGDIPYPTKKNNPDLKVICDRIEKVSHIAMWPHWGVPFIEYLTDTGMLIFKIADYLDLWEFALLEIEKGNKHAQAIISHIEPSLKEIKEKLKAAFEENICENIEYYMQQRIKHHSTVMENVHV